MRRVKQQTSKCLTGTFLVITFCGIILIFIWPAFLKNIYNFVLTPNSILYQPWQKTPFLLAVDFYFFNWTNPEDIYNSSVKPKFEQVGPFRYSEVYDKSNITWNQNGTITYQQLHFWYLNKKDGSGDQEQKSNIIDPILLSAAHVSQSWSYVVRRGLYLVLSRMTSGIIITRTIHELLFGGYKDLLIDLANTFPFLIGKLPVEDKFGFYYKRNGSATTNGVFNVGTGVNNTKLGRLYSWNYMTHIPFFENDCQKIEGSAGDFFETESNQQYIRFFQPNICRPLLLNLVGKQVVENIEGNKYVIDAFTLDNGTLLSKNKCYCNGECIPSGVLNIWSCNYNIPLFLSLPHFYNADPYYNNLIEGLKPEKKKHEFSVTLEPNTNLVLEVKATVQLNILLQPIPGLSLLENIPKVFVPIMWSETRAKLPIADLSKLKLLLVMPAVFAWTGTVMTLTGLFLLLYIKFKTSIKAEKEQESLSVQEKMSFCKKDAM